jgi:mono/diheme cytochrome c family protein
MKRAEQMIFGCLLLATAGAIGQTNSTSQQTEAQPQAATRKARTADSGRGEQVFHQNCFRCHQEPEGFSPSISKTIATHMRVRAGLSDPDVKALLEFLNP